MRKRLVGLAAASAAFALVAAGCGSGADMNGAADGITVVTSTNVWGAVAADVAGEHATVDALYTDPTGDPHSFTPSAADTARVADADVIVLNGGHYDEYMERASANSDAPVINAFDFLSDDGHDHSHGDASDDSAPDDKGHNHGLVNEHVFYDLAVVAQVADHVADALAEVDPTNADDYRANAATFTDGIDEVRGALAEIKAAHDGAEVAQSEPLAGYLLTEAGLHDVAPAGFTAAIEEGQSPSAADRAAMEDLLRSGDVRAFVYNIQTVDAVTEAMTRVAESEDVPVVELTETLPEEVTSYLDWQRTQIDAVQQALGE